MGKGERVLGRRGRRGGVTQRTGIEELGWIEEEDRRWKYKMQGIRVLWTGGDKRKR